MNLKQYYVSTILLVFSLNVQAEYKSTGEMTQEEYQKVSEASAVYNECLNDYAISLLEKQNDARVIADHSMKHCAHILEDLNNFLLSGNYAPQATSRFVSSISNRNAKKLLSNLMLFMAAKQQQAQPQN